MLEVMNSFCLSIMDVILGWLLYLPRDLTLFIVGIGTASIMTGVRVFTTNQNLLKRCKDDKTRLDELIKAAKKQKDKEALLRYRATKQQIDVKVFKAEGKPTLASLIPVALVCIWCFGRVAYLPLDPGASIPVKAYFPISKIGEFAHMVPENGVQAKNGWIQKIKADEKGGKVTNGIAEWEIGCAKQKKPYLLTIRFKGESYTKELLVDGVRYAEPFTFYTDKNIEVIEAVTPEYKLLGLVPGFWVISPWLLAYLIMVVPFSLLLKPILRIY